MKENTDLISELYKLEEGLQQKLIDVRTAIRVFNEINKENDLPFNENPSLDQPKDMGILPSKKRGMAIYKPRVCETCGKKFIPTNSKQRYCLKECNPINIKKKQKINSM